MNDENDQPIWSPSPEAMANSQMMRFLHYVNEQHQLSLPDYASLYDWSITYPELFWVDIWNFCQVLASKRWDQVLQDGDKMPGAQWFTGARLNFAENLLRHNSDKTALIFWNEHGDRRSITYSQLHEQVRELAAALWQAGVQANDRVAGLLPNMPEAIIAMLATTSIGAIWSSCSPDFGVQGVFDRFYQIQPKILFAADGYYYNGKSYDAMDKIRELVEKIPCIEKTIVIPYLQPQPNLTSLPNAVYFQDFRQPSAALNFAQLPFNHPVYILYSSGTTGAPKCIVHGAGGVLLQHLKELMLHTDLRQDDVFMYFTTCGWMMWNFLVSGLLTGATLVLYDGSPFFPHFSSMFDLIDREHISVFGCGAKFIATIEKARQTPIKSHRLNALRTILSTGSPLLAHNFDYVYQHIKKEVCLSSISGGTDIVSCFALGNPLLPVYKGELQCRGLGLKVEVFDESGQAVQAEKGELVCTAPFPVMPVYFWNDPDGQRYHDAYFAKFPGIWAHGDYAELTIHGGLIIYGRSDATLKPAGVRIGTAEIYKLVETIPEIAESAVIGQDWQNDVRIILFVKLQDGLELNQSLTDTIKETIRKQASIHHIPAKIIQVPDIPKTINGKIVELAIKQVVQGQAVKNKHVLANPESLDYFKNRAELIEVKAS